MGGTFGEVEEGEHAGNTVINNPTISRLRPARVDLNL
jgi:hypothetical protein